ncbi:hypothetical protein B0H21DRAFT_824447 [Amylocystis lapponica]|nr:hypothetical protein B0H21DRAFT_824447 [Amylocystis lapponica]
MTTESTDVTSSQEPSTASAPFDKANADVVLRSSDNVEFHVHTLLLGLASGLFEDMFALPQPTAPTGPDAHPCTGLPLIYLTEDGRTLDCLLRLCYPVLDPVLDDLALVESVLRAAMKYQLDDVVARLCKSLSAFAPRDPLRVYTIACVLGLDQEARDAALALFHDRADLSLDTYMPDMDRITAGAYYRLLQYCGMLYSGKCPPETFTFCTPGNNPVVVLPGHAEYSSSPLTGPHPFTHQSADLIVRSSEGVDLRVHQLVLSLASPVLADTLKQPPDPDAPAEGGLRVLSLPEQSRTLAKLLQLCYPMEEPAFEHRDQTLAVLEAALRYGMPRATQHARRAWRTGIKLHPPASYIAAVRNGWADDAREAISHAVLELHDVYVPEMEDVSARVYRHYLLARQRLRDTLFPAPEGTEGTLPYWSDTGAAFEEEQTHHRFTWAVCKALAAASAAGERAQDRRLLVTALVQDGQGTCVCKAASLESLRQFVLESQVLQTRLREAFAKIDVGT